MFVNTSGIVLREVQYKDISKILTVLTSSEGKLTVSAHRAHSKNSKLAAVTGLLVFSEMTLLKKKDRWTMTEARSVEQFLGLRDDLKLLALGAYIAELTEAVADEDSPNPELLPLCLNALYALSEKLKTPEYVKPAFELRLMAISGFEPLLSHENEKSNNSLEDGTIKLSAGALNAAKYILSCDAKKLFSFTLSDNALRELSKSTEKYLLAHLDRTFKTLDYYRKVL
ncbi:MAG: DNA repair protein RecO [Oscillospiraceae bacterium]|jgi:DNA repair protein RecO (recombination protein O)|nr:DNA repair protein RecO [Oscillospiraceae bacterium]